MRIDRCLELTERDGVLTNVLKPDKLQVAGAQAVDALALVGANDHAGMALAEFT